MPRSHSAERKNGPAWTVRFFRPVLSAPQTTPVALWRSRAGSFLCRPTVAAPSWALA